MQYCFEKEVNYKHTDHFMLVFAGHACKIEGTHYQKIKVSLFVSQLVSESVCHLISVLFDIEDVI
jgi:hypothetical protein